jgi:poly-gamma-glutamate synthase PgsB/CapB
LSVLVVILAGLVAYGLWEYLAHLRNLRKVRLRVHVNGTRGKSSVTRLIAAGLRSGGVSTCAKTTGSRPRMILENGSEYTIQRQGRANIIEQVRAVAVTAKRKADALVAECMALQPSYQALSEDRMLRSAIGVITNARPDHLDVMGPSVHHVALALSGTTPRQGKLITGETDPELLAIFDLACRAKGTQLIATTASSEAITDEIMRGFGHIEHPENVAVALRVCQEAGIDRELAIAGMHAAVPDAGALRVIRLAFWAKKIDFINALAANDPDSTLSIWNRVLALDTGEIKRVALLNCRADRPGRSTQLGAILPQMKQIDRVLLIGSNTRLAMESALSHGLHPERLIDMQQASPPVIFERAVAQIGKVGQVFGMGNIGGGGNALVEYFNNRALSPEELATGEWPWKT